jgi:hypothetical protein
MIVSHALYVSDLFEHWLEHLFVVWHILYPWFVSHLWLDRPDYNKYNTVQYNTILNGITYVTFQCQCDWLFGAIGAKIKASKLVCIEQNIVDNSQFLIQK